MISTTYTINAVLVFSQFSRLPTKRNTIAFHNFNATPNFKPSFLIELPQKYDFYLQSMVIQFFLSQGSRHGPWEVV